LKRYSDLEYLKLSRMRRFLYKLACFFLAIPVAIKNFFVAIGNFFKKIGLAIFGEIKDICTTFVKGSIPTKLSYIIMGFGNFAHGQILRGLMFLGFEAVFIIYMVTTGSYWLSMLPSLGKVGPEKIYNELLDTYVTVYHDNSFKILLYGVLSLFFILAFIITWRMNINQNKTIEKILASGKKLKSGKQDLHSLVDDQFHKTLLALPVLGITIFTVLPIVFMILVAFTNYDGSHDGCHNNLFNWVGLDNFNAMLNMGSGQSYGATFAEVLTWTLIWAFFATFTNYFLGMFVAMMINKKGIKLKKFWRTVLVLTIAIPQFISLLYVSKMFAVNGVVNGALYQLHIISDMSKAIRFLEVGPLARVMVIVINIWIGIPYLMLIATGILMNIPQDLYEASRVDGANGFQQYTKITLPYMLFITGPYLLTSFTSNMNNFNVIYLLTTGGPTNDSLWSGATTVGYTDLLVTWLFKMTTGADQAYYMASVIGILIFVVVAVITLIVYSLLPSVKNEEDFQ